ncbi:hypothetical protein B0O99DRAFT_687453 [Bisporella sp. PMI_857]|nr:hypothetical protein B0O99DRAFT_687453 [Bisporella sp. PMI_857]
MLSYLRTLFLAQWIMSLSSPVFAYRPRNSFKDFFPDVKKELQSAVVNNCSKEYQKYVDERINLYGEHCVKMFSCVMDVATEYTKANFASAGVLLGLTPTILATIGSSTPELALLSYRRPFLAFLVVLGAPAVSALRALDYNKSILAFASPEQVANRMTFIDLYRSSRRQHICIILEYIFALAAVSNLAHASFVINRNTIAIMSCDNSDMLVELWIGLALVTHGFGIATFRSRSARLYRNARKMVKSELTPCAVREDEPVVWYKENNKRFVGFSWFITLFTILHLSFGTLMFSSLFFVGTPWAAYIIFRFVLSALICRTVVAFELASIRVVQEFHPGNPTELEDLGQPTGVHAGENESREFIP